MTATTRKADASGDGRRKRRPCVFVVDDDVAALSLLCEVALESGWDVRGFRSLAELRQAIDEQPPSLLILDDELPDGRGGDLARELREHRRLERVPVVVCTAAHPMRRAEISDWAPVVAKPFDLGSIQRLLESARPFDGRSRTDRAG